jgi:hypothetical protein
MMTSTTSTADVATDRAARYGKQLVSHLGRRSSGEWNDDTGTGWIALDAARAELQALPHSLRIVLSAQPAECARFEDVVGRHLVRFGVRDELVVRWSRAEATPGTVQQNTGE